MSNVNLSLTNSPGKGYVVHSMEPQNYNLSSIRQSSNNYKISGSNNKQHYNLPKENLIKISKDVFNPNSKIFDSAKNINYKNSMGDITTTKNESTPKIRYTIKSTNKLNFSTRVPSEDQLVLKQLKNQQPRNRAGHYNEDQKNNLSSSIHKKSQHNLSKVEENRDNSKPKSKENSNVKYSIRNHFLPENFKQKQVKKALILDKNAINGKNMIKYKSINLSEIENIQPTSTTNNHVNQSGKYLHKQIVVTPNIDKSQKIQLQRQPEFENFIKDKNTQNRPRYNQSNTQEIRGQSYVQKSVESNSTHRNSITNSRVQGDRNSITNSRVQGDRNSITNSRVQGERNSITNSRVHGGSKHYINLSYRNKSNPTINKDIQVSLERKNTNENVNKEEIVPNRNSEKIQNQKQNSYQYFGTKNTRQVQKKDAVGTIKNISSTLNFANANHIRTGTGSLVQKNDEKIISAKDSGRRDANNQSNNMIHNSVSNIVIPKQNISAINLVANSKKNINNSDISIKQQDKNILKIYNSHKQTYSSNASCENINQQIQKHNESVNYQKRQRSSYKSKNGIKAISNILNNHSNKNAMSNVNLKSIQQENPLRISMNSKRNVSQSKTYITKERNASQSRTYITKENDNTNYVRSQNNSQINLDSQIHNSGITSTKNSELQKKHHTLTIESSPVYEKHSKNPLKTPSNLTTGLQHHQQQLQQQYQQHHQPQHQQHHQQNHQQHHQQNHQQPPKVQKKEQSTWKTVKIHWNSHESSFPNINKELQAISVLGKGSFATVYEAYDKRLKMNVAVKVYEKKDQNQPDRKSFVQNEIDIMANVNHKYIAKYYRILEDAKAIYIIQEIGGEISQSEYTRNGKNKKLAESDARVLFKQLVSSVKYLHEFKVCHRDLKLTNILVNEESDIKLIDFGFSTIANRYFKTYCGTPSYMSPELVKKMEYDGIAVDLWAMGVILYKMVTGDYPFGSEKDKFLNERILACDLKMPNYVSLECRNLITSCLQQDPQNRITCAEMLDHAFTRGIKVQHSRHRSHAYSEQTEVI